MAGFDPDLIGLFTGTELAAPGTLVTLLAGGLAAGQAKRRRRERRIDLALHELRRPLQALLLLQPSSGGDRGRRELTAIDLALAALADLESALDRARQVSVLPETSPVDGAQSWNRLLTDAADRWQQAAWLRGGNIAVECLVGDGTRVDGADEVELARALDNLILNALIHGGGHVVLQAERHSSEVVLRVCDRTHRGPEAPNNERQVGGTRQGNRRVRRHGQGLRAVRQIAARHGGYFKLHRHDDGATAILKLPSFGDPH